MNKKRMIKFSLFVIVIACIIGYNLFFTSSNEVKQFNNKVIDVISKSNKKYAPFFEYIKQYSRKEKVSLYYINTERDKLEKTLKTYSDTLKKIKIPSDDLCKEFHAICVKYMDNALDLTRKYQKVIDYIKMHNPGDKQDIEAIKQITAKEAANDTRLYKKIGKYQKEVADKFNLVIESESKKT